MQKLFENEAIDNIAQMQLFVDNLLKLGDSLNGNRQQLNSLISEIRQAEINSQFITIAEIAEALKCQPIKASKLLKEKGVPVIEAGKTYVVSKRLFLKAFTESEYEE